MESRAQKVFVGYYRVSTAQQGQSGLGLEAQQEAVKRFVGNDLLAASFVEIESGRNAERPQLARALAECRRRRATLVIAKLDRLSRNVLFIAKLLESDVELVCCDLPSANRLVLHMMSAIAQNEAEMISARTRSALAAAKARGAKLGGSKNYRLTAEDLTKGRAASAAVRAAKARERAAELMPVIDEMREAGVVTLQAIADGLTERGISPPRGGKWQLCSVSRIIQAGAKS